MIKVNQGESHSRDCRVFSLLLVIGYAVILVLVTRMTGVPFKLILQAMGVPALDYPIMDLRGVASWCELYGNGGDPAVQQGVIEISAGHQYGAYLMNYSPIVLGMFWLGLLPCHVVAWAVALLLMYGLSLWFLADPCSRSGALLWCLLICSPLSIMVVERGNLDMLLFTMLVAALAARNRPMLGVALILAAALLKFFPAPAFLAFWKRGGRRDQILVVIGVGLLVAFLFLIRSRLGAISGSLSGQCQNAFGCVVIPDLLVQHQLISTIQSESVRFMVKGCTIVLMFLTVLAGFLRLNGNSAFPVSAKSVFSFFLAAPMMIFLFIQGNQMDYKWIFLLFMVPAILELKRVPDRLNALAAHAWLVLMLAYSYWNFFSDEGSLRNAFLKQAMMWAVMMLTAFLAGSIWKKGRCDERH
jgi:hypothetical protein